MELGYGFFVEMEWPYFFFLFIVNASIITYSNRVGISIFVFYSP